MRLLSIIIVAVGMYSGWILLQRDRAQKIEDGWALQCSKVLDAQANGRIVIASPGSPDEGAFFKILHFMRKAEMEGRDLQAMVGAACEKLSITGDKRGLIQDALIANYETARKLKVFDDPMNMVRLEQGQAALIALVGWQGEPVAVGVVIPPVHAPELSNHLINLVLLPSCVRDAQTDRLTKEMTDAARKFERAGALPKATLESIYLASRSGD
ncbi:hypothetical protein [Verrucomicrobium sp. BvORR106]|uniref:hypothetical protein n=1 Tax=Verrucomicrobium sp. BvORR106 TaxID=1403819 RepID=UPI000A4BFCF6|nr:hypothetical protein [Verrucomicrobium sp. BvORR106]